MFIGLDKLINQGLKKVIVAVPERSIGSSFKNTDLTSHGFFSNWEVEPRNNLTSAGGDKSKVQGFIRFMESDEKILVCTHATLRFAFEQLEDSLLMTAYWRLMNSIMFQQMLIQNWVNCYEVFLEILLAML